MSWLIIAGAIQSIFLSLFLFVCERGYQPANRLLGLYFLNLAVFLIIPELIRSYGDQLPHLIATTFPLLFLIGPLLLVYTMTVLKQSTGFKKGAFVHFVPSLVVLVYLSPFYTQSTVFKTEFLHLIRKSGIPSDFSIIWFLACIHIIAYLIATYSRVAEYNRLTEHHFSRLDTVRMAWLERFTLLNAVLWGLYSIGYVMIRSGIENDIFGRIDQLFAVSLSFFIYYITFVGLSTPELFPGPHLVALQKTNIARSALPKEKRTEYVNRLTDLMENQKPYLNPNLSLAGLASMLDLPPRVLSQVINEEFKKNFFDYVNYYRVQEVKKRLLAPEFGHLTIVAIGLDSGFSSKSTFNEVFKKLENSTPSKFKSGAANK